MPLTFFQPSQVDSTFNGYLRNRIINGAMMIDQRNAGASVSNGAGGLYTLDRWNVFGSQASKVTIQQNGGGVTAPAGFKNYLGVTSSSAYTVGASESFSVRQYIEGFNTSDLNFGSASAATITLSFWVRSSLTGAFGGTLYNGAGDRFYPFSYTINSANTWEQKFIVVAGDTSGTWVGATNGTGLAVQFSLGAGSSVSGTAGAWTASAILQPTGSTSVVGTNGATWYVTGVQLEVGSVATPFERRMYGTELMLCMRYYEKSYNQTTAVGSNITVGAAYTQSAFVATNNNISTTECSGFLPYQVMKRTGPTCRFWDLAGNISRVSNDTANNNKTISAGAVIAGVSEWGMFYDFAVASPSNARAQWAWDASAEL